MEFQASHVFDAPIDEVWAMFRDPRSHIEKFESMGHRHIEVVDSHADESGFHLTVRREVDVELPGFARRALKPTNTVTSTDEWRRADDGSCTGRQAVKTEGAPVKIASTTRLTPEGPRTRYDVEVELEVKVPLIGGKLADWSRGRVRDQLDQEFAAGDRWLAGRGA